MWENPNGPESFGIKKRIKTSGIPIITYVLIAVIVRLILRPKKIARGRNKKTETPEDIKFDQSWCVFTSINPLKRIIKE